MSEPKNNDHGSELAAKLETLLTPYISDDEDDDDMYSGYSVTVGNETSVQLKNEAFDGDDLQEHKLLMRNSPNLKSLMIGEDDSFFPGRDDDEQWEATGIYLGNHTHLTEIGLGYMGGVMEYNLSAVCKGLARNSSISKLIFTSGSIFDRPRHVEALTPFLRNNNITCLVIRPPNGEYTGNHPVTLDKRGILLLALMLTKFNSLKSLELEKLCNGTMMDDEVMPQVFDALGACHPGLSSIKLSGTTLGRNAKHTLSKLDVLIDESTSDGNKGLDSIFDMLLSPGTLRNQKAPKPVIPTEVQPGILCEVDGLKSEAGKKLNARRCAIVRYVAEDERYEVRMENESGKDATFALKKANLRPLEKLVLPTHSRRGSFNSPQSLCELLLYYKDSGPYTEPTFSPSRIVLTGYAGRQLAHIGSSNLMWLVQVQIEQLAGAVGLASICQDYGENGAEKVLFALLEGDPMYIDVLIQTIHWTGLIDHEECDEEFNDEFNNCPPTKLTPDQDSKPYVKVMTTGPFRLLVEMTKYKFGSALWAAMKESEFYSLFIQRLLRLVGRESLGTHDGKKLGPMSRKILMKLLPGINVEKSLRNMAKANDLLTQTSRDSPCNFINDKVSGKTLNAMFFSV